MSKTKQPIIYHGMLNNREELAAIAGAELPPDAEVLFAWQVTQGSVNGPTQLLDFWYTRAGRFFDTVGIMRYDADHWEFKNGEVFLKDMPKGFDNLLKLVRSLNNVKLNEPTIREAFMRILAKAEELDQQDRGESEVLKADEFPFRGTVKLGGVGISEPEEN